MIVRPLRFGDMAQVTLQPAQVHALANIADPRYEQSLMDAGPAFAALDGDRVIACIGVIRNDTADLRGTAWAFLAGDIRPHMTALTRAVRRWLSARPIRRIEAAVRTDFYAAQRWAVVLGFQLEGRMRQYMPDGRGEFRDAYLYARVD